MIMATEKMVCGYILLLSLLTGIMLPPSAIMCASHADFQQYNIKIRFLCSTRYVQHLDTVVEYIKTNEAGYGCSCVELCHQSHKILSKQPPKTDKKS